MTAPEQLLEVKLKELRAEADLNVRPTDPKDEAIRELAASIKAQGILEPVVVVKEKDAKGYRLVFGFRRVAAARLAGLTAVPAVVRSFTDGEILESQLVENLQREDLSPLQEARALQKVLSGEDPPTQLDLAKRLGKSQPWLSNRIRLLGLPEPAVKAIESGQLSPTHGEILLQLPKEATPNEVNDVLSRGRSADMSTGTFKRLIQDRAATINRRTKVKQQRRGAISRAKFPTCPVKGCGKNGSPESTYNGYSREFYCRNGHRWDSVSGKVAKREATRNPERQEPKQPPKPTLPFVPLELAEHPGVEAIGKALLGDLGKIVGIQVRESRRGEGVTIELTVEGIDVSTKEPRVSPFSVGDVGWPKTKSVRLMEDWSWQQLQSTDKGRKQAATIRQGMIDWLGTIRGPGRPKKDAGTLPDSETARNCAYPGCGCILPPGQRKYCGAPHPHAVGACEPGKELQAGGGPIERPAAPSGPVVATGTSAHGQ